MFAYECKCDNAKTLTKRGREADANSKEISERMLTVLLRRSQPTEQGLRALAPLK